MTVRTVSSGRTSASSAGFTVIELLIAMFVLVSILAGLSIFFSLQVQLQRNVQNRNNVQDRARVALQLVSQDLALAGNPVTIRANGTPDTNVNWAGCTLQGTGTLPPCVDLTDVSATSSTLRVRYVSSQFTSALACRDVSYRVTDSILQRSDVTCDSSEDFVDLVPGVLGFKVVVVCSDSTRSEGFPTGGCGSGDTYGRSAIVSFGGSSLGETRGGQSDPVVLATSDPDVGFPVTCPANRVCFGMTQEVLMPNIKDK